MMERRLGFIRWSRLGALWSGKVGRFVSRTALPVADSYTVYQGPSISRWSMAWSASAPLARTLSRVKTGLGFSKKRSTWSSWDVERGSNSDTTATVSIAPDTAKVREGTSNTGDSKGSSGSEKRSLQPTLSKKASGQLGRKSRLEEAPNILLNLHHGSNTGDLVFAAISGTILQLGVLVFSGFATYSSSIRSHVLDGQDRSGYGYPLLAIGTVLLTIGMIIAAYVIEQSTVEKKWRVKTNLDNPPEEDTDSDIHVLWLQKQHVVGDQSFDSFVLQAKEHRKEIFTSRRSPVLAESILMDNISPSADPRKKTWLIKRISKSIARNRSELLTLLGAFLGLSGFVLQFQGFRGVN
ncbi:uncharacterized protein K441DRAFT_243130 [Cenococcum geophilum 1.58]|uniref:uncharacterized protein n=1 Tax=Cenococcum geophilum 1.58 TaxID=794803 RepID=UPI00358F5A8F|nr:hypothetical protein K441DRAFT_243130 [Cenococcum geophilum 1.58]